MGSRLLCIVRHNFQRNAEVRCRLDDGLEDTAVMVKVGRLATFPTNLTLTYKLTISSGAQ